ncbi:MAG: peptidase M10 [Bacteroidetes bacterium]|nr:MAG: peptidase M10 [Bacteroidota bacterium]
MGIVYPNFEQGLLIVESVFYFYGTEATQTLAAEVARRTAHLWNAPGAEVAIDGTFLKVVFRISGHAQPRLLPQEVWYNTNPANNYFRVESYCVHDVSFVDGVGSNSGYFKLANLQHTPTTAAHEYGHSLGLDHPAYLDIRGMGQPGIMYPRGTVVDGQFQYNAAAEPGNGPMGGTMDAAKRLVLDEDVLNLGLHKLRFRDGVAVLGSFTAQYHEAHVPQF